jgi:hypothetical protein
MLELEDAPRGGCVESMYPNLSYPDSDAAQALISPQSRHVLPRPLVSQGQQLPHAIFQNLDLTRSTGTI